MIFTNQHDPRYVFDLNRSAGATTIRQLNPPGHPLVWLDHLWGQWNRSPTTRTRAAILVKRLTTKHPASAWFRNRVLWSYP